MPSIMEIMQMCRLCLVKDQVNIPIFEEQGDIRQIFLKITACLPVKVAKEDNLPKKICDGCLYKLELLYQFWNTTANAEKQLLNWLDQAGMDVNKTTTAAAMAVVSQSQEPVGDGMVKQENIDSSEVRVTNDASNDDAISDGAQSYILQQQQLPYEPFSFGAPVYDGGKQKSTTSVPSATVTREEGAEPPAKRAKRAAAMKNTVISQDTASDEEDDDLGADQEEITKMEDDSDLEGEEVEGEDSQDPEPTQFVDVPSTSTDVNQPGPSGVGKTPADTPLDIDDCQFIWVKTSKSKPSRNRISEYLFQKYENKYNLKDCVVVLGDLNAISSKNYKFVRPKHAITPNDCDSDAETPRNETQKPEGQTFKCLNCFKRCQTRRELESHMVAHVRKKVVRHDTVTKSCLICHKKFSTLNKLYGHMASHSTAKQHEPSPTMPFQYRDIAYQKNLESLNDELRQVLKFRCHICKRKYISLPDLRRHKEEFHNLHFATYAPPADPEMITMQTYEQDNDNEPKSEELQSLQASVSNDHSYHSQSTNLGVGNAQNPAETTSIFKEPAPEYRCQLCKLNFYEFRAYVKHVTLQHVQEDTKDNRCETCGQLFMDPKAYNRHLDGHKKSMHPCKTCRKSFMNCLTLCKHLVVAHDSFASFKLSTTKCCHYYCKTLRDLPQPDGSSIRTERFSCPICRNHFSTFVIMKKHMVRHMLRQSAKELPKEVETQTVQEEKPKILESNATTTGNEIFEVDIHFLEPTNSDSKTDESLSNYESVSTVVKNNPVVDLMGDIQSNWKKEDETSSSVNSSATVATDILNPFEMQGTSEGIHLAVDSGTSVTNFTVVSEGNDILIKPTDEEAPNSSSTEDVILPSDDAEEYVVYLHEDGDIEECGTSQQRSEEPQDATTKPKIFLKNLDQLMKSDQSDASTSVRNKYKCVDCQKEFANHEKLLAHMRQSKLQKCTQCNFFTCSILLLNTHYHKEHVNQLFCCCYCGFADKSRTTFEMHLQLHEKQDGRRRRLSYGTTVPVDCGLCSVSFSSALILRFHLQSVHNYKEDELI